MQHILTLVSRTLSDGTTAYVDSDGFVWQSTNISLSAYNNDDLFSFSNNAQLDNNDPSLFSAAASIDFGSVIRSDIPMYDTFLFVGLSVLCVILGGITSGLNVSLLSIDEQKLALLSKSGSPERVEMCRKLAPIIKDHHLLLVTILVANASAMEALPVFLDDLVAPWFAVVISVTFVLIFGEIGMFVLFAYVLENIYFQRQ